MDNGLYDGQLFFGRYGHSGSCSVKKVHEQRAMVKDCLCEAGNGSTGAVFACPEKNSWMSFTVTAGEMRF